MLNVWLACLLDLSKCQTTFRLLRMKSQTRFHTNKSFAPHLVFWARIIYWSMMVTAKKTLYSLAFSKGNCQHKTKDSLIHGQTRGMAYNLWTLGSLASNDCALQVSVKNKFHANTEFVAFFFFFLNFYLFPYSSSEKLNHQSGWWMNKALFISWGLVFSNNTAYLQNYTAFKNIYKTISDLQSKTDW